MAVSEDADSPAEGSQAFLSAALPREDSLSPSVSSNAGVSPEPESYGEKLQDAGSSACSSSGPQTDEQKGQDDESAIVEERRKGETRVKHSFRPSTAVRRRVKKISEEFALTQSRYESSLKPNVLYMKSQKGDQGQNNASMYPSARRHQSAKASDVTLSAASKCDAEENFPPSLSYSFSSSGSHTTTHCSRLAGGSNSAVSSAKRHKGHSGVHPRKSAIVHSAVKRLCQYHRTEPTPSNATSQCSFRLPNRRPISNPSASPRLQQISFEQLKKAKQVAEKAIKDCRVFSIYGYFPAIRSELLKRGWVEKYLHTVPYMNPHPHHCVCPHSGCHGVLSALLHPSSTVASSSPLSSSSTPLPGSSSTANDNTANCEANDDSSSGSQDEEENKSPSESSAEQEEEKSKDRTESSVQPEHEHQSQAPTVPASLAAGNGNDSQSTTEDGLQSSISDAYLDEGKTGELSEAKLLSAQACEQSEAEDGRVSSTSRGNDSTEYLKKIQNNINTAILGPSDIRKGLAECITEKNASIYQYSMPMYEKKPKRNLNNPGGASDTADQEENTSDESQNGDEDVKSKDQTNFQKGTTDLTSQDPPSPYPELDYELRDLDMPLVARLLRSVEPNLIWTWNRDSVSFKHLGKDQMVNRFPNTPFTTKYGLCNTLQQLHWFSEAAGMDTFVPRSYCIGHEDERAAFIHDYRTTACLNILKWLCEASDASSLQVLCDQHGEVSVKRVRQALVHVKQYIQTCCHDDLDLPPPASFLDHEWDALLTAHYRIIYQEKKIRTVPQHFQPLLEECRKALRDVLPFWPQLEMDGIKNVWIVKPGAQSRGRGIILMNRLEQILSLVQSPFIYETKYVVQKYIERPLLIYNTKFDIRQWFLVTDWNPLSVWMYRESYLRFCSQQFDLDKNDEAVHLSNNAIQCKYHNGTRSSALPEENMWDCYQFQEFLRSRGEVLAWENIIYPGMRDALVAAMLAAQVEMDTFKNGFELFGADFMLTDDFRPMLIEINSSPCMASTTSVTRRMCAQCLRDIVKVVVDYKQNKASDTGMFELVYNDNERVVPNPPYLGVNLQVIGHQLRKGPLKPERRKSKRSRPTVRVVKTLPLITLSLEDSIFFKDDSTPRSCPFLDCRLYASQRLGGPAPSSISEISSGILTSKSSVPVMIKSTEEEVPGENSQFDSLEKNLVSFPEGCNKTVNKQEDSLNVPLILQEGKS